eukprot:3344689-Pleurochrysis_carterae.AAC.1
MTKLRKQAPRAHGDALMTAWSRCSDHYEADHIGKQRACTLHSIHVQHPPNSECRQKTQIIRARELSSPAGRVLVTWYVSADTETPDAITAARANEDARRESALVAESCADMPMRMACGAQAMAPDGVDAEHAQIDHRRKGCSGVRDNTAAALQG